MRNYISLLSTTLLLGFAAAPAAAQGASDTDGTAVKAAASNQKPVVIQHVRPQDKRGLTVFEPSKETAVPFEGFKLDFGAAFTQQFQALSHSNTASERLVNGVNANELADLGWGFNLATANFYLNAQLAPGVRVALESYMSSRHHSEFWVKGGYLQIDASPLEIEALETLMRYLTLKVGHFEVNYGDAHFRRTDNGNALFNPFVENYIMDAFATEIGAEAYFHKNGFLAMAGVTNGEIQGGVVNPDKKAPSFVGKLGYDYKVADGLRMRLTGSVYTTEKSANNTLYAGDRAGSRYYNVMDNATGADFRNGRINPGLSDEVTAYQLNPFVKVGGVELFGVYEKAAGRNATELENREWSQYAGDLVYRFLPGEAAYVGGRYNVAEGHLAGVADKVSLDRVQLGAGWFVTPSVLMKAEYVTQKYKDFPALDIRNGGKFSGFIVEGVVAF
jgi:hypothetical protein